MQAGVRRTSVNPNRRTIEERPGSRMRAGVSSRAGTWFAAVTGQPEPPRPRLSAPHHALSRYHLDRRAQACRVGCFGPHPIRQKRGSIAYRRLARPVTWSLGVTAHQRRWPQHLCIVAFRAPKTSVRSDRRPESAHLLLWCDMDPDVGAVPNQPAPAQDIGDLWG
jgi:hypothetical protein